MPKPVIVAYDGSELSRRAFPWGVELARRTAAPLHVVRAHVFSVPAMEPQVTAPYEPDFLTALIEYERADLNRIAAELSGEGVRVHAKLLENGLVVPLLRDYIQQHDPAWVVMTTHGRGGFNRLWLGSTATGVIKETNVPIVLLPESATPYAAPPAQHIAVALDGSEHSESMIQPASELARIFGARMTLLEVVSPTRVAESMYDVLPLDEPSTWDKAAEAEIQMSLSQMATRLQKEGLAVAAHARAVTEPTAASIIAIAKDIGADMIALSTHGRGFWSRAAFGSVADKVLRTADLPLLVYHPSADE